MGRGKLRVLVFLLACPAFAGCTSGTIHAPTKSSAHVEASPTGTQSSAPANDDVAPPTLSGSFVMDLTWVSHTTGWALAASPCSEGLCPQVARTDDGGATWERPSAPLASIQNGYVDCARQACVTNIRFASPSVGYLFGAAGHGSGSPVPRSRISNRAPAPCSDSSMTTTAAPDPVVARCSRQRPARTTGGRCGPSGRSRRGPPRSSARGLWSMCRSTGILPGGPATSTRHPPVLGRRKHVAPVEGSVRRQPARRVRRHCGRRRARGLRRCVVRFPLAGHDPVRAHLDRQRRHVGRSPSGPRLRALGADDRGHHRP